MSKSGYLSWKRNIKNTPIKMVCIITAIQIDMPVTSGITNRIKIVSMIEPNNIIIDLLPGSVDFDLSLCAITCGLPLRPL